MEISVRRRNAAFALLLASAMVSSAVQTALNTALSPIMAEFSVPASSAQLLSGIYSLVMGISVLVTPFLIRRIPVRPLFFTFFGVFTAGLAISGFAPGFAWVLSGRVLQAIGCGILMSLTQVVILTAFPAEKRGSVMGLYGLATCTVPVLSPTLAGILIDLSGWRMIFFAALAASVLLWLAGLPGLANLTKTEEASFDTLSLLLCGTGYTGIVLGLGNIGKNAFLSMRVLGMIVLGMGFLVLFVWRQQTMKEPFLHLSVLKNRSYRVALISSMLLYAAMMAGSTLVPVYLQSFRGMPATVSGLVTMPGSLITAVCTLAAGRLYDRFGIGVLSVAGTGALLLGNLGLCFLTDHTGIGYIAVMFAVRAVGIGMLLMTLVTWGMKTADPALMSDGTALLTSLRTVAGAMGTALFVSLLTAGRAPDETAEMIAGTNASMRWISLVCLILLLIAAFRIARDGKLTKHGESADELTNP